MTKLIPPCPSEYIFTPGRKYIVSNPKNKYEGSILEARGLIVFSDYKFIIQDAIADEILFYKYVHLRDGQVLGRWQDVITSLPLEIKFSVEHYSDIYVNIDSFPKYDEGFYILDGVFFTKVFLEPHCCDGKVIVRHARGVYNCIKHWRPSIEETSFPECSSPLIFFEPVEQNPSVPPVSEPPFPICIPDSPI